VRKPEQTLDPGRLFGASPVEASAEASPAGRPKTDVQLIFFTFDNSSDLCKEI